MPARRTTPPARGERAAVIGYRAQYRAAAALIIQRLAAASLDSIRLADPEAGKLDDLQIIGGGTLDACQFKWSLHPGSFTFRDLTQGGSGQPALIQSLFDAWKTLRARFGQYRVIPRLVSNDYPSVDDMVPGLEGAPAPRHFAAFLGEVWEPLRRGELTHLPSKWAKAGDHLRKAAGATPEEWADFVKVCKIDLRSTLGEFPAYSRTARQKAAWEKDVKQLTEQLSALVASPAGRVEFTRTEILRTLGWSDESVPRHAHDFPVDERIYEPIDATVQRLRAALSRHRGGYLCLTGPPGAGKSSLLTRTLRTQNDNVIRYYAFVPSQKGRDIFLGERGEAANFLHDLSSELTRLGIAGQPLGPHHFDLHLLRARFEEQLAELADEYRESGRRTLILVDGLDHIGREQAIGESLLGVLPSPDSLPDGVLFILGTQTADVLPDAVERHIRRDERHISIEPLSATAVRRALRHSIGDTLDEEQIQESVAKIGGHPLALGMLVNALRGATGAEEIRHVLATFEKYEGDINRFYDKYWSPLRREGGTVLDALGLLARLGPDIDLRWVETWMEPSTLRAVRERFHQFFRRNEVARRWSFFHNSFRLFVRRLTAEVTSGEFDQATDRHFFHRLAESAAATPPDSYWRGEEVFYRAQAGESEAVLALVTPERSRAQFYSLRPEREISEHLALAREALVHHPSLPGIIRLGLVERELRARSESLGLERDTFYSVLLASGRYDLLMTHLREGSRLDEDSATVLRLCEEMWLLGLREEARSLFDLVDPRQDTHHFPSVDHLQGQSQTLLAWLLAGVEIVGVSGSVEMVRSYEFTDEHAGLSSHYSNSSASIDQEAERYQVLADGVMALYARGRWALAAELRAAFEGGAEDDKIQTEYEFSRAEESLDNSEPQRAMDYMRALLSRFDSRHTREKWRLAEACARAGLYSKAEELTRATTTPPLDAVSTMQLGVSRSSITPLQYHRLRYACGETSAPARLVPPDSSPQSAGLVLFYRATCVVARLWGKAWRGEAIHVEDFRREASELLASLNRRFNDQIHWRGLYSDLSQNELAVYSALIEAGKLHGPAVIEALTEVFASEWSQPERRVYWTTRVKRDVCLDLARAGANHNWVVRWLECCEQETGRPENANSHASDYSAQARAWLQINEVDRAAAMMFASARSSPGMTHSRDDQLKRWVSLLGKHWAKEPAAGLSRVAWFVHCLKILDFSADHHELRDASARTVWAAYLAHPAAGPRTFRYLLDAELVRYDEGLSWMLHGALSDADAPVALSFSLICHLLLPVALVGDGLLSKALFARLGSDSDGEQVARCAGEFARVVCTEALPATRRVWLRGAARGAWRAGCSSATKILTSALEQLPPDAGRSYRTSDDPSDEDYDRLAATVSNFASLSAARTREGLPANFPWHEILGEVARNLSPAELVAATELFSAHSNYAKICEKAGEELSARGRRAEVIAVAEKALDRLDAGSDSYGDTRNAILVCGPLLQAAPERALARLSTLFARHGGPELDLIETLVRHAADGSEKSTATEEIDAFVQAYFSGCGEADAEETTAVGDVPVGRSASDELLKWLFDHLTHPIPLIRHSAQKAVGLLLITEDVETCRLVSCWLVDQPPDIDALLFVLEAVAHFDPQILNLYRPALESLACHKSFDVRSKIASICARAGWPAPDCFESKPLSSLYQMVLATPSAPPRGGSIDARLAGLSADPTEGRRLTESFTPQLRALAEITGIPYGNLVRRILQFAQEETQGRNLFDPVREEQFAKRLSSSGLLFSYHRPHTRPARRALSRMLAELVDGGIIPISELSNVELTFAREDAQTLLWQPAVRPPSIPFVSGTDSLTVSRENWIQEVDLAAIREPWTTPSGRYVLASVSQFRLLGGDRRGVEQRASAILPQLFASPEPDEVEDGLFEVTSLLRAEDYWHEFRGEGVAGLAVRQDAFIVSPNEPWLALHPLVAKALGWTAVAGGLFRWQDERGQAMAESRWWRDGQVRRSGREGQGEVAEGWQVLVSPNGLERIQKFLGDLVGIHRVQRSHELQGMNVTSGDIVEKIEEILVR